MQKQKRRINRHKFFMLSRMLLPALQGAVGKVAESDARLRCAQTALAVERWRLRDPGERPEDLARFVPAYLPEVPRDPCDGEPLRYRRLAKGYVIYSVGKDGTDDGGAELPKKTGRAKPYDVTFTVEK